METSKKKRAGFTSRLGFILAAAGSAIGLGNLWRFPFLAAKDGGGLFVLIYIILCLTFGFTLMMTEIAIGRKTQTTPLSAYGQVHKKFEFLGMFATLVPALIFPYYCVIGGWVTKYAWTYATGGASKIYNTVVTAEEIAEAAAKGQTVTPASKFFNEFITGAGSAFTPILFFLIFMGLSALIVLLGVEKGIEKASKLMMPVLFVLVIGIAVYSLTLKHTDPVTGETRTAIQGLGVYLIPNFDGITFPKLLSIILDAMGQMFYSLSIAMGILITYGSYCDKDTNLSTSVNQIEIFDTGVALLAGLIVVPSVFVFQGTEGLKASGPSLMFISLPQVFEQMGVIGHVVGALFFILVLFAALTSSISLMEAVAASLIDRFKFSRKLATLISFLLSLVIGLAVCLGYNIWYFDLTLPNGSIGQFLDILDYLTNNLMLPIVAGITCVLIGWFVGPKYVLDEVEIGLDGKKFRRKGIYVVMVKYVCPVLLFIILLQAFNAFSFLG